MQRLDWRRKALIALVIGLFLLNHRAILLQNYRDNSPVLSSEEITELEKKVEKVYVAAKEKIAAGTYTPLDWQRDVYFFQVKILRQWGECYGQERFYALASEAHEYAVKHYYEPQSRQSIFFHQQVMRAQNQVLQENGERIDWGKIGRGLHGLMLAFLPYAFLIVLIRRGANYKPWQIGTAGNAVCVILAVSLSVFGALAYRPNNFLQKRIDSQLRIWKEKIGARGWRLALAYLVAIVVSLATLLRPAKSQVQVAVETQIISIVPAATITTHQEKESDKQNIFFSEKVVGFLRRFFEEVMGGIETLVFNFFSLVITQFFSPPLEFVWGLWARPPDQLRDWVTIALGSRAPTFFVLVNSLKTWTKNLGASHENYSLCHHRRLLVGHPAFS